MAVGAVRGALSAAAVALGLRVLAWLAPEPAALIAALRHPQDVAEHAGIDALALSVAAVACWAAVLWLVLALTASAGAGLPGRCGQLAGRFADATVPPTARRLLAIALGLSLVTAAGAAPAIARGLPQQRPPASVLDLDWPVAAAPPAGATPLAARQVPAPRRSDVVVLRGDSLWSIARRHLPPNATNAQIAASWPRWWAANRSVVGADPDLLLPGQRLVPPDDTSGGQP